MNYIWRRKLKRREEYPRLKRWVGGILILGLLIFLGRVNWQVWQKQKQANQTLRNLKAQADQLRKEKEDLEKKLQEVDETSYLEKIAREKLNLKKPGEKVVAFVQTPVVSSREEKPSLGWWQKWWQTIKTWFSFKRQ